MASSALTQATPTRIRSRGGRHHKDKESSSTGNGVSGQQPTVRLKVVIRHLPSLLKESEFRDVMSNYINDETCDFFSWNQGKIPEDRNKAPTPSRCYTKMKDPVQVAALSNAIRTHGIFTDSRGNQLLPQMEFSPFQKAPKRVQRVDTRAGTIGSDPDFQAFLALLGPTVTCAGAEGGAEGAIPPKLDANAPAPIPANDPLSVPLPTNEPYEKPKTTPLIEFIRGQKASPGDKAKSKATEKASSEGGRPKRAERRAREKAKLKGKEREKSDASKAVEPTALLKRVDSGPSRLARQGSSSTAVLSLASSAPRGPSNQLAPKREEKGAALELETADKGRRRERERRRGGIPSVAAILQRDLGISAASGGRRARGRVAPPSEPATPTSAIPTTPVTPSVTTPTTPSFGPLVTGSEPTTPKTPYQPPASPSRPQQRPRERPSRRERRAAKLEREESNTSNTSASANAPSTPIAILRSQSSGPAPGSPVAMLAKRESTQGETSSDASSANASPSAAVLAPLNTGIPQGPAPTTPTTPTGPRGGRHRGGPRGGPRGGMIGVGNVAPAQPQVPASPTPPTGPAAGVHGPFGRGGHRGAHRGRGQPFGGRGGRGGGSRGGISEGPAGGSQSAGAPPSGAAVT